VPKGTRAAIPWIDQVVSRRNRDVSASFSRVLLRPLTQSGSCQTASKHLPTRFWARFRQRLEEVLTIRVVQKYVSPAVTPAHDILDGGGIFRSYFPRHGVMATVRSSCGKPNNEPCNGLTPFIILSWISDSVNELNHAERDIV
jgi:hypothetical protein